MMYEQNISDYDVICKIGSGEFGTCYKVKKKTTHEIFVWKAIDYGKMTERDKERIVSEVNVLSALNHPNIVRYYGRFINKKSATLYIIMECCDGGDLKTRIKKCKKHGSEFDERFVWHILYQTARAVQACHSLLPNKTVLHRDIKPANVFLDAEGNVKLGDFGLARTLDGEGGLAETCVGTPYYMSPEVLKGEKYSRKSDVWSLGCLVHELCALSPPFNGCNLPDLAANILKEKVPKIPSVYSHDLQNIISQMLTVKPELRPAIEVILHHPTVVTQIVSETFDSLTRDKENTRHKATECAGHKDVEQLSEHQDINNLILVRLQGLKIRESVMREKELAIASRERALEKREKEVSLLDRMTKEKMLRADVYLNQCRDSRSMSSIIKTTARRHSTIEPSASNIDTSFSADPGDTSILPTSSKMMPSLVTKPSLFVPKPERHVHFDKLPKIKNTSHSRIHRQPVGSIPESHVRSVENRKPFRVIQEGGSVNADKLDKAVEDNFRNGVLAMFNDARKVDAPTPYMVERCTWLQNKRVAYNTVKPGAVPTTLSMNKENSVIPSGSRKCSSKSNISSRGLPSLPSSYIKTESLSHYR